MFRDWVVACSGGLSGGTLSWRAVSWRSADWIILSCVHPFARNESNGSMNLYCQTTPDETVRKVACKVWMRQRHGDFPVILADGADAEPEKLHERDMATAEREKGHSAPGCEHGYMGD